MDQVSIKYTYQHLPLQDPPKFTQIWIFILKTNHLATLLKNCGHSVTLFCSVFLAETILPTYMHHVIDGIHTFVRIVRMHPCCRYICT
jgi:hypothetical protein